MTIRSIRMALALLMPLLCAAGTGFAQQPVIPLYPGDAPGSENATRAESSFPGADNLPRIRNVVRPTLTVFLPAQERATGTAIVVAPGGAFMHLAIDKEGYDVARWLQARGVAAFVLKYRLMDTGPTEDDYKRLQAELARATRPDPANPAATLAQHPARQKAIEFAVADGAQAVRLVRRRAAEWGIAPDRIGLMGFSAGGMLTMGVVMKSDAASRPNFAAPIYGGGTGGQPVPTDAPPLFIAGAHDDPIASANSARLYIEWKTAGRSAELHIYSQGGHGFGMSRRGLPVDGWIDRFGEWLRLQGLLKSLDPK